jgi:hypothetical protein
VSQGGDGRDISAVKLILNDDSKMENDAIPRKNLNLIKAEIHMTRGFCELLRNLDNHSD